MYQKIFIHQKKTNDSVTAAKVSTAVNKLEKILKDINCTVVANAAEADCILALGGDGTLLSAGQLAIKHNIPIAGIHAGHLGFLTSYSLDHPDEINHLIQQSPSTHHLNTLVITFKDQSYYAINEVLIHRSPSEQIAKIRVNVDHSSFEQSVDGMIASTATGSTGYALSSGGPLIHPSSDHIALVAVAAHSLNARPMILQKDSKIKMTLLSDIGTICIDGIRIDNIQAGESIDIESGITTLNLHHPKDYNYYDRVIKKLQWQRSPHEDKV